jgi:hypothetical protein
MRHLTGLALAVALGAAVFFAATWGYLRLLTIPVTNGGAASLPAGGGSLLHDGTVLYAFAALAGTALLAGLCVAIRRISPLAAGLPGLVAIAWTIVYGFNVDRAVRYIPFKYEVFGDGFEAMLVNGLLAVAGLVLVVPLFIPSRWRSPMVTGGTVNQTSPYAVARGQESAPATTSLLSDSDPTAPYPTTGDTPDPYAG